MSTSVTSVSTTQHYQPRPHQDNAPSWQALLSGTAASSASAANNSAGNATIEGNRYTGGASPSMSYPGVGAHVTKNSMAHDSNRVGLGTLSDDLHMLAGADGALSRSELMKVFNNSSVKAQAILDGAGDGNPVKVDDLIEKMKPHATTGSPRMFTASAIDKALRDIMGEVKGHFDSFADANGKINEASFKSIAKEAMLFLGEDMPSNADLTNAFKAIAGLDMKVDVGEFKAFMGGAEDKTFSLGKFGQALKDKIAGVWPHPSMNAGNSASADAATESSSGNNTTGTSAGSGNTTQAGATEEAAETEEADETTETEETEETTNTSGNSTSGNTNSGNASSGSSTSSGSNTTSGTSGTGNTTESATGGYTGGVSPNSAYPNVGSHIAQNSMSHDPNRVGLGTLSDDLHLLAGADGALSLSELMQAFNISSVKAQAILDGLGDGGPVKVDDLIEALEEYATSGSPKMLTNTKLDEALREIMGEVKTHFASFADENGKMDATRFKDLVKEGLFFLGEDMPSDANLNKAFRALAGVDELIGKDELGAFVAIDDDGRLSIGQMTQKLLDKIATYGDAPASGSGNADNTQNGGSTGSNNGSNGTDANPDAYTGGVSPNSAYPNVGSHITQNSMSHDPNRVGLGTLSDDLHLLAGADGALSLSELMQAFNISSVKAQAILDGLGDGGPVKVDDLIKKLEEYATGGSPRMLTNTKLDEALRDIMGEVKTHFASFAGDDGKMTADQFRNLLKESFLFLGRDLPGQSLINKLFGDIAGIDQRITKDELGAFVDMDEDGRFSIGKLAQKAWEKIQTYGPQNEETTGSTATEGAQEATTTSSPPVVPYQAKPFPQNQQSQSEPAQDCNTQTGTTTGTTSGGSTWAPTSYSNGAWSSFFNPVPTS